jgi:predicted translin family RNA/ssDNA-binding protein
MKPSQPLTFLPPRVTIFDLSEFGSVVAAAEGRVQLAYDASRKLQVALNKAKSAVQLGQDGMGEVDEILKSLVPEEAPRDPRAANLSNRLEDYVRLKAYAYFLETGKLLPPSDCKYATDEEYLAGACMGLAHDLSRYAMGRATARDVASVTMSTNLVNEIQNELLQFDFRNGPLRRKYDGTKYALKNLETLLYELSVTGTSFEDGPEAKRIKEDLSLLVPHDEIAALRQRMEHRDELRENLIKKSRDGQKASKNAIFALHRGDKKKAFDLIHQCLQCIQQDLLPIVVEEPPLRAGSFSNVLEEYTEAKLFYCWLFGKQGDGHASVGDLLMPNEFEIELNPDEYLGGLCDLTGEIGRYAVQRGTARDTDAVKLSLHSNSCILDAIQTMERTPSGINKKMDQLHRSVEKLERMLYEMSLSEATGRKVQTSAESAETENMED